MIRTSAVIEGVRPRVASGFAAYWAVLLFSLLYLPQTLVRASEKRFWYDELCTLYICRLPAWKDSWAAVLHGADFNPPLFYLIHRANIALFGDGLIAMRLPEIAAFWVFCVCIFVVVSRRNGLLAGVAAMLFPLLSGAYFYAFDARPHGIVLGFAGLALWCWQRLQDRPASIGWLLGFSLSLLAASLTHCYAVLLVTPFAVVELARIVQEKAIRWRVWFALGAPVVIAALTFLPLLASYKATAQSAGFSEVFPPDLVQIPAFYQLLLGSGLVMLVLGLGLVMLERTFWRTAQPRHESTSANARMETVLALAFLCLPIFGLILARAVHGPFFGRYFMSALMGVGIALGYALGAKRWGRSSVVFALALAVVAGISSLQVARHRLHGWGERLTEPSVRYVLGTDPDDSLSNQPLIVAHGGGDLPIAAPSLLDFLYLVHYWPNGRARLYPISPSERDSPYMLNRAVREWCHVPFNREQTFDQFFSSHSDFLIYGLSRKPPVLPGVIAKGGEVQALWYDTLGHYLARVHMQR